MDKDGCFSLPLGAWPQPPHPVSVPEHMETTYMIFQQITQFILKELLGCAKQTSTRVNSNLSLSYKLDIGDTAMLSSTCFLVVLRNKVEGSQQR
jgi:hypothetical protein